MPAHLIFFIAVATFIATAHSEELTFVLPAVPYPSENPPSPEKNILGKLLFWDEQLSTDNTVACGSCHLPRFGGADVRLARHPGYDKVLGTSDDIMGSPGVVRRNAMGEQIEHPVFGLAVQATNRSAPGFFQNIWASSHFWDGRAESRFVDPLTEQVVIQHGGSLESQSIAPLMSDVEMASHDRKWEALTHKLSLAKPLALASAYSSDVAMALEPGHNYPYYFQQAFGDTQITPTRIAFALASYERSLVSDGSPWDLAATGDHTLSYSANLGWEIFKSSGCVDCHAPPLFTDNKFHNIGIQGRNADEGRFAVSNNIDDLGAMRTPGLRNVGLKTRFMHTGHLASLEDVLDAYADVPFQDIAGRRPNGEDYDFQFTESQRKRLLHFLRSTLTDPRVANASFPFDRPGLRAEHAEPVTPLTPLHFTAAIDIQHNIELRWQGPEEANAVGLDYEIVRNDGQHYWTANTLWIDNKTEADRHYRYAIRARNAQGEKSDNAVVGITTPGLRAGQKSALALVIFLFLGAAFYLRRCYRQAHQSSAAS